jgi:hypothetical protein
MSQQIFDILGIGLREDSYTDLLVNIFANSEEFRKNFLKLLKEEKYDNWEQVVRYSIGGNKPDWILYNRELEKIIVIENKILSKEGLWQTDRYSSPEFKEAARNILGIPDADFSFYLLSLNELNPRSPNFIPISYLDIRNCLPDVSDNSDISILARELKERIDEYYNWEKPKDDDEVLKYLRNVKGWVNIYSTFRIMAESIIEGEKYTKFYGSTQNRQNGYTPLAIWEKPHWKSKPFYEQDDGSKHYSIHYEFQWATRTETLLLYLHYHPDPAYGKKDFKATVSPEFYAKFYEARKRFHNYFQNTTQNKNLSYWRMLNPSRSYYGIAECSFQGNITFKELKNKIREIMKETTPIIEEYLEKYHS